MANYDGRGYSWYRTSYKSLADKNGVVYRIIGRAYNVDAEKLIESELEGEKSYKEILVGHALVAFEIREDDEEIKILKQDEKRMRDFYPLAEYCKAENFNTLYVFDEIDSSISNLNFAALIKRYKKSGDKSIFRLRVRNLAGEFVWVQFTNVVSEDKQSGKYKMLCIINEVDEQVKSENKMREKAEIDYVSGLLNRQTLEEKVSKILLEKEDCAFIMFDLDNFKRINDTYGHVRGDALIAKIGSELKNEFKEAHAIGRIGGDEFVIFMTAKNDESFLTETATKLKQLAKNVSKEVGIASEISVSVGITFTDEASGDFVRLLNESDNAMYVAKAKGKNCVEQYQK